MVEKLPGFLETSVGVAHLRHYGACRKLRRKDPAFGDKGRGTPRLRIRSGV